MSFHDDQMPDDVTDAEAYDYDRYAPMSNLGFEAASCCGTAVWTMEELDREPSGTDHDHDCDNYDGAPLYRDGMGPGDPVRCDND